MSTSEYTHPEALVNATWIAELYENGWGVAQDYGKHFAFFFGGITDYGRHGGVPFMQSLNAFKVAKILLWCYLTWPESRIGSTNGRGLQLGRA